MPRANDLRRGHAISLEGNVFMIIETEHVAKGNKRSYMQIKLRNLKTGQLIDQRFRVNDEVESAFLEKKEMEYLYSDGTGHVLMDLQTYDQQAVGDEVMGDGTQYLKPNTPVEMQQKEWSEPRLRGQPDRGMRDSCRQAAACALA